jgi:hypothetical protein
MGSPDARAYSRNKRGIAGSLIWINFDRHSLLNLIQKCAGTFVADIDEIRPQYTSVADGGAVFSSSVVRSSGASVGSTINQLDNQLTSAGQNAQLATPWYSDQVLPFDVTLSGANEYGAMCAAKIYGLEILNEGFGISIDDANQRDAGYLRGPRCGAYVGRGQPIPVQGFSSRALFGNHRKELLSTRSILRYIHIYESLALHILRPDCPPLPA